jgi:glycerol kinase
MKYFLALDQSTSATKALLFDASGGLLDKEAKEHRQFYPRPGWVEHDAEEIWQNTVAVLQTLVRRRADKSDAIASLSVTNQRETIVIFDRATGRPVAPAIVWQCRRGAALCVAQGDAGRGQAIHARTGLRLDAYFSGSKLQWLVREQPDLARRMAQGEVLIGTIDAYLIYRLTEGRVFATDVTNASRTLLFDIGKLRWDEELCSWWEVPMVALPEVRESSAYFGETTLGGALAQPLTICGVMGDSQASLFAHRCFQPGMAKVTFGTGSSILLNIGSQLRLSDRGVVTALAWVHRGVPTYAFEGIIISSAASLAWLRDQLELIADYAEGEKLASEISDTGGVYLVPAFSGLGFPHWQSEARGAVTGLSAHSGKRQVVRAAFEAMAYQLRDVLEAMRAESDVPLLAVHGDGGPTANRFLMQFTADLARAELRVATMADCSPFGAVLAGMLGTGRVASLEGLANLPRQELIYRPAMDPARAQQLYAGWQQAVREVVSQLKPS